MPTKSFLSQLRDASVTIDGVPYALDDYPTSFIDMLRGHLGDNISAIVAEIEELGFSADTAPEFVIMVAEAECEAETFPAYACRDPKTGEEMVMLDPPGGTFRDLGDEYVGSAVTGLRLRDRRDGYWKNGVCVAYQPDGEVRAMLLKVSFSGAPGLISVPALNRTNIFPDGYEIIEKGSLDGWLVWQWCMANAKGTWEWVNLGAEGGPWVTFNSLRDRSAFLAAFPELGA